jgi:hypothetical protein
MDQRRLLKGSLVVVRQRFEGHVEAGNLGLAGEPLAVGGSHIDPEVHRDGKVTLIGRVGVEGVLNPLEALG